MQFMMISYNFSITIASSNSFYRVGNDGSFINLQFSLTWFAITETQEYIECFISSISNKQMRESDFAEVLESEEVGAIL